jgi:hypothetical protein
VLRSSSLVGNETRKEKEKNSSMNVRVTKNVTLIEPKTVTKPHRSPLQSVPHIEEKDIVVKLQIEGNTSTNTSMKAEIRSPRNKTSSDLVTQHDGKGSSRSSSTSPSTTPRSKQDRTQLQSVSQSLPQDTSSSQKASKESPDTSAAKEKFSSSDPPTDSPISIHATDVISSMKLSQKYQFSSSLENFLQTRKTRLDLFANQKITRQKIFGQALDSLMIGKKVPLFVEEATAALEKILESSSMPLTEVFNVSVKSNTIETNKKSLEAGALNFSHLKDPKEIASLLICFFVELPEPLIPPKLLEHLLEAQYVSDDEHRNNLLHSLIYSMPQTHRNLLKFVLKFIGKISNAKEQNLAYLLLCFGLAFTKSYSFIQPVNCLKPPEDVLSNEKKETEESKDDDKNELNNVAYKHNTTETTSESRDENKATERTKENSDGQKKETLEVDKKK